MPTPVFPLPPRLSPTSLLSLPHSKILLSKQKIIDLFPRIEKTLESIKDADNTVMQMQIKRQREFWHLLKIACVSCPQLVLIKTGALFMQAELDIYFFSQHFSV